ncbi:hypothetical protein P153DRAFT_357172 [Dothidotthia symphoricarpi CBS 119687]|uniref:Uncharacterized protein n=1 Tax=Dothidotthia symphoricarpi CBS 119687 TaxID=1392245 RepID=A0A6A6AFB6_9PLEO|nr:uncharacterized protein P153DRAFT_357172 [Dothidotthia symphoricarpi CBS 119687]KAF2129627.1 hypothetical protein P153DRAFT_357172 [Dothidotthia symphoricarpi CBS 119687]
MNRIYSIATKVVVWLGDIDSEQATEASRCVKLIANQCRKSQEEGGLGEASTGVYFTMQVPSSEFGKAAQESLRLLYAEPWFPEFGVSKKPNWPNVGLAATWLFHSVPIRAIEFDQEAFYADIDKTNAHHMLELNKNNTIYLSYLSYWIFAGPSKQPTLEIKITGSLPFSIQRRNPELCV